MHSNKPTVMFHVLSKRAKLQRNDILLYLCKQEELSVCGTWSSLRELRTLKQVLSGRVKMLTNVSLDASLKYSGENIC